jgi:hypothetical protein
MPQACLQGLYLILSEVVEDFLDVRVAEYS